MLNALIVVLVSMCVPCDLQMATHNTSAHSRSKEDGIFDILLPGSPLASQGANFSWSALGDDFSLEDVVALDDSALLPTTQPSTVSLPIKDAMQASASSDANVGSPQDPFDGLDAFLEVEFPMDGTLVQSPTGSSCWAASAAAHPPSLSPAAAQPAVSTSNTGATAPTARTPFAGICNILPAVPESAASPAAQSAGAIAAAVAAVRAASGTVPVDTNKPIPRWKLYHMQQKQELLAPKQPAKPTTSCDSAQSNTSAAGFATPQSAAGFATPQAAVAAAAVFGGCGSPAAVTSVTGVSQPVCRTDSVSSSFTGVLVVPSLATTTTVTPEQVLLMDAWRQQQQLQLMQQQQAARAMANKRALAVSDHGLPQVKRSRTTAAGSVAAQNLYGLPTDSSLQLQQLQVQLQAQLQQNHQQQQVQQYQQQQISAQYQQQQISALHQQLHMRLQVQQYQQACELLRCTTGRQTCP